MIVGIDQDGEDAGVPRSVPRPARSMSRGSSVNAVRGIALGGRRLPALEADSSATTLRALIDSSNDWPTPELENMPMRWPPQQVTKGIERPPSSGWICSASAFCMPCTRQFLCRGPGLRFPS